MLYIIPSLLNNSCVVMVSHYSDICRNLEPGQVTGLYHSLPSTKQASSGTPAAARRPHTLLSAATVLHSAACKRMFQDVQILSASQSLCSSLSFESAAGIPRESSIHPSGVDSCDMEWDGCVCAMLRSSPHVEQLLRRALTTPRCTPRASRRSCWNRRPPPPASSRRFRPPP